MNQPSLLEVFRHYGDTRLHDGGRRNQLTLCPVHDEDHPSCSVNLEKGVWNCKACKEQGNAYSLIMTKEGLDFGAAHTFAEATFGILPEPGRGPGRVGLSGEAQTRGGYRPKILRRGVTLH